MMRTGRPERVDVYRRRRGARGQRFRFLLSVRNRGESDAFVRAKDLRRELQRKFPDYEYLLVIVQRGKRIGEPGK